MFEALPDKLPLGRSDAKTWPIRHHITTLVLAALIPLMVLAVGLTSSLLHNTIEARDRAYLESARALSGAADVEVERSLGALKALALHDSLQRGDLKAFHDVAVQARSAMGIWNGLLVLGPRGEHLLNSNRPYGERLPPLTQPQHIEESARTAKPYISNALVGAVQREHFVYVTMPVVVKGKVEYVLEATISHRYWTAWLSQRAPAESTVALIDRDKVIFARNRDTDKTVGISVQGWYRDVLDRKREGVVQGPGVVDDYVQAAFVKSSLTGWTLNVVTPGDVVSAPIWRAALILAAGSLLAIGVALLLSYWRAKTITNAMERVNEALADLRDPEGAVTASVPRTRVLEVDSSLLAIRRTAESLHDRAQHISRLQAALESRALAAEDEVRQRQKTEAALVEQAQRREHFVALLAHELRNPLAPIRNASAIIKRAEPGSAHAVRARETIDRQVDQMTHLLDDLLDIARISHGKLDLRVGTVDLQAVLNQAVESTESAFAQAGVKLQLELPHLPLTIQGDQTRLVQVFSNLLVNAAKFTPQGGLVQLRAALHGEEALIEVSDDGRGIAPENVAKLFEPFSQVTPVMERGTGGLGLGLSLVKGLVMAHRGSVEAQSAGLGLGSTFSVRLPVPPESSDARAEPGSTSPPAPSAPSVHVPLLRILVADDNSDGLATLSDLLRIQGHEVRTANDGVEALDQVRDWVPQVALLDIGMPKLTGLETARALRSIFGSSPLLLAALTGFGQEGDRQRSMDAGFDHHLVKPVTPEALNQLLLRWSETMRSSPH